MVDVGAGKRQETAPQRFGRYTLLGRLARGGMADIYAAELAGTAGFRKRFVIKRMRPHLSDEIDYVRMFLEEARIGSQLSHPKICEVFELAQIDGEYYIAMEYLHGAPLSNLISETGRRDSAIPVPIAVGMIVQACEGLHYAHERRDADDRPAGVIHRDVSPQNLFVRDDGVVKLLDFGIAKAVDSSHHTKTGTLKGKEIYMSPEQLRGKSLDRRTDVWSLGVVLYEALSGAKLFRRGSLLETAQAIANEPVPALRHRRPDVPPELDAVIERALSRERESRYGSAEALRVALLEAMGPDGVAPTDAIGDFVHALCGPKLAKRDKLFDAPRPAAGGALAGVTDASGGHTNIADMLPLRTEPTSASLLTPAPRAMPRASSTQADADRPTRATSMQTVAERPALRRAGNTARSESTGQIAAVPRRARTGFVFAIGAASAVLLLLLAARMTPGLVLPDRVASSSERPPRRAALPVEGRAVAEPVDASRPVSQPVPDGLAAMALGTPSVAVTSPADAEPPPADAPEHGADADAPDKDEDDADATDNDEDDDVSSERSRRSRSERRSRRETKAASRDSSPEAGRPGSLYVDSVPYATIFVDGTKLGVTPILGEAVPPGKRSIRAVAADGRTKTVQLQIDSGETVRRRFRW